MISGGKHIAMIDFRRLSKCVAAVFVSLMVAPFEVAAKEASDAG
jgi:hypothetical protein